ncbi:MAG: hypothetical protein HZA54_18940 [Planctomycetes bacterium]|nr:hypothetical protein [Planctomycetota bacterium]
MRALARPAYLAFLLAALAALLLAPGPAPAAPPAAPAPAPSPEPPRKLALVVAIDNHNRDPLAGALAEGVGGAVTSLVTLSGKYDRLYLRLGPTATRANLLADLLDAVARDYVIDLVIESHGNTGRLQLRDGDLTAPDIDHALYLRGGERLRLVYMMGCYSASLNDAWLHVGARAVTGHVGVNVIPVFHLPVFLREWVRGTDARTATQRAFNVGRRAGLSGIYRRLAALYGEEVTEKSVREDSRPVFAGRTLTIHQIPTRAEEAAWLRARLDAEGYW